MTRHIFYCHGIDRRGPSYFRRHQRRLLVEAGVAVEATGAASWRIKAPVETSFDVFDWSDLIKADMARPAMDRLRDDYRCLGRALREGFFGKVRRRDWALSLMLLWGYGPLVVLPLLLLAALWMPVLAAVATGLAGLLWHKSRWLGMAHIRAIGRATVRLAEGRDRDLAARRELWLAQLAATRADEIVLVGHSVGAAVAVDLLARLRAMGDQRAVTLLTVGQSIPLVSLQSVAAPLRNALHTPDPFTDWIDISARRDILGFQHFDPSGGRMRCYSARFYHAYGAARLSGLRFKAAAMHYLYFERVLGDEVWDWPAMLSEKAPMAKRFARAPRRNGKGGRRSPV